MNVTYLDEATFRGTFIEPIERVGDDAEPIVEFWSYFDAIDPHDFEGHDCSAGQVERVYRMADRFEHVLATSTTQNVFMAIVLDLADVSVLGHRLMNFNELYGLENRPST